MEQRKLELLSPAGSLEILKSVVGAGADAVYFGGTDFGARAYAKNFTMEEGREGIAFAHLHGAKAYLTVNTLLKNREIEKKLYPYLKYYYESGLDAVIVQDLGVFSFVREFFPDLAVHASTQMTVTGAHGAQFLYQRGAVRIVTARELSLEEIREIHNTCPVEIEAFVHGALCYCYSGQCLMSSLIGGRSGNRGRCAQPCRLPYTLLDDKRQSIRLPGEYLLSLKDFCALELLPRMAEAGVYSLKIEGRMKQSSYAAGVVSVYRKYVDTYLTHGSEGYCLTSQDNQKLIDLGSRNGFTNTYLTKQNDVSMITLQSASHRKLPQEVEQTSQAPIPIEGRFTAVLGKPAKLQVWEEGGHRATVYGGMPEAAKKQAATEEIVKEKLNRTGGTPFVFSKLELHIEPGIFLPMQVLNNLRRRALDLLKEQMLDIKMREALPYRPCGQPQESTPDSKNLSPAQCYVTVTTKEQFDAAVETSFVDILGITVSMALNGAWSYYLDRAAKAEKQLYLVFPVVLRKHGREFLKRQGVGKALAEADGVMAASYDVLGYLEQFEVQHHKIMLDHRLYTFSDRSVRAFEQMGYRYHTAPLELNSGELSHRLNRRDFLVVYGRYPLMITANCPHSLLAGCDRREGLCYLRDRRGEEFPVRNDCSFCYNEIYNSRITCLFDQKELSEEQRFYGYRLDFTLEDAVETKAVLRLFDQCLRRGITHEKFSENYTKGHWKRGVE